MLRWEPFQILVALVAGASIAVLLLNETDPRSLWRVGILPAVLLLIVRSLVDLVALGRDEWRREPGSGRAYILVVLRFVIAYILVALASS